ncbi:MAG: cation:proton antiporter subunit C [Pseudomonadota bacterium]
MLEAIIERGNYWIIIILMMTGLYITFASTNLIKRLVGLSVFQTSVFLFYITLGKVAGGTAPVLIGDDLKKDYGDEHSAVDAVRTVAGDGAGEATLYNVYSNPLPHVLILTAIVVGVATLAVGLAIIVRIRESYGTIENDELRDIDIEVALAEYESDLVPEAAQ